jgi:hypothetical protein
LPYSIYAAPIPVPAENQGTMLGMRYSTEKEAIEKAAELRRAGWFVYRVTGPNGFEITGQNLEEIARRLSQSP